jgi:hypothetical protein
MDMKRLGTTLIYYMYFVSVMFERWKEAKRKIDLEKYEADRTRAILETSLLRPHFYKWKIWT